MTGSDSLSYPGNELSLFLEAHNWKAYLAHALQPYVGPRVLEIGAGKGAMTRALKREGCKRWLSLEPDSVLHVELRRNVINWQLEDAFESDTGTISDLPEQDNFDTILYLDVLEHIANDAEELIRASRRLAPGGCLVVVAPAHQWLYTEFDRTIGHYRRYRLGDLRRITPSGLSIVCERYYDSVGIIALLVNKLLLHASLPSPGQIRFWDSVLVPLSRLLDPLLGYTLGRSVAIIWRRI